MLSEIVQTLAVVAAIVITLIAVWLTLWSSGR